MPKESASEVRGDVLKKAGLQHFHFLDAIAELPYVDAIYLFGSRARGDFRKNSDIDLVVKYNDNDEWHRKVVRAIISEISDTSLDIDMVDYDDPVINKEFKNIIDEQKVVLYERA